MYVHIYIYTYAYIWSTYTYMCLSCCTLCFPSFIHSSLCTHLHLNALLLNITLFGAPNMQLTNSMLHITRKRATLRCECFLSLYSFTATLTPVIACSMAFANTLNVRPTLKSTKTSTVVTKIFGLKNKAFRSKLSCLI